MVYSYSIGDKKKEDLMFYKLTLLVLASHG